MCIECKNGLSMGIKAQDVDFIPSLGRLYDVMCNPRDRTHSYHHGKLDGSRYAHLSIHSLISYASYHVIVVLLHFKK
jgi:hypothetical protein